MRYIERLQSYLRHAASLSYEAVAIPPFTAFFHPIDDLIYFNYAIPDQDVSEDVSQQLVQLNEAFEARHRRPRWEYLEEFAPNLAPALRDAGFEQEAKLHLMVCSTDDLKPLPSVPNVTIEPVISTSPRQVIYDYMLTQRQGFNPAYSEPPTDRDIDDWIDGRGGNVSFLARFGGEPACAGGYTAPYDGICEIVGIATRPQFRKRGIASALTAHATQTAFNSGVEVACLTAGDERAGRVYEHIGYHPYATTLFYSKPE